MRSTIWRGLLTISVSTHHRTPPPLPRQSWMQLIPSLLCLLVPDASARAKDVAPRSTPWWSAPSSSTSASTMTRLPSTSSVSGTADTGNRGGLNDPSPGINEKKRPFASRSRLKELYPFTFQDRTFRCTGPGWPTGGRSHECRGRGRRRGAPNPAAVILPAWLSAGWRANCPGCWPVCGPKGSA